MDRRNFIATAATATAAVTVIFVSVFALQKAAVAVPQVLPLLPPVLDEEGYLSEDDRNAQWGTYGKGGGTHCKGTCPQHQLRWVRLVDCETPHLLAILATQYQISYTQYPRIIKAILKMRGFTESQIHDAVEAVRSV